MADKNIKIVINGEDKTSGAISAVSKGIKGLNTDVSGLAKVLGGTALAGVGALTAFLVSSAKGAADAEVQIAKVTSTLSAMGEGALKNKDAILEASQAAVKLGFDDEAAALSITKFYQRTNDLTKAQELSNLAMDLARAKSIDLEAATTLVGQALSGNGRALAQYGILIKDAATPLEALTQLQGVVGGQSQAFAGTFNGQMAIIEESVSNLKDTIGASLLEAIIPLLKTFTEWANKKETQQKIKDISEAMGQLAKEEIPILIESFKILVTWGTNVFDVMVKIGDQLIKVINYFSQLNQKDAELTASNPVLKAGGILPYWGQKLGISGARAEGGPVMGGSSYLVGENGPELFTPGASGFITPNGGGGSITINISGNTLLDDSAGMKIANQIMSSLKGNLRI